jgi:predicted nucleotidyltransferase
MTVAEKKVLRKIKETVHKTDPAAKVILYGSRARGDHRALSDWDLLILVDSEKVDIEQEKALTYPLYHLEWDSGELISPMVFSKKEWNEKHRITPLFENIKNEGIQL